MDARQKIEAAFEAEFICYEFPSAQQCETARTMFGLGYRAAIATHTAEIAAREAEITRLRRALMHIEGSTSDSYASGFACAALTQQPTKD